jgi:hypothetical protein
VGREIVLPRFDFRLLATLAFGNLTTEIAIRPTLKRRFSFNNLEIRRKSWSRIERASWREVGFCAEEISLTNFQILTP